MSGAVPLLAQAEREGRHWRELLDDSALHPRLVVRPPNGLLKVWHREAAEGPPDQLLDLSKLPCTARADDFWNKKAVAGNLWSVMFNSILQRDQHTPHTDNLILPVDFWSHIPEGCKTVRVSLATLQDSDGKPYGVRFTPQHIWITPPPDAPCFPAKHPPRTPLATFLRMQVAYGIRDAKQAWGHLNALAKQKDRTHVFRVASGEGVLTEVECRLKQTRTAAKLSDSVEAVKVETLDGAYAKTVDRYQFGDEFKLQLKRFPTEAKQ